MKSFLKFIPPIILLFLSLLLQFGLDFWFEINGETQSNLKRTGEIFLIISIAWGVLVSMNIFKKLVLLKYDIHQPDNLKSRIVFTQYNLLQKVIAFIIILVAISLILMLFESVRRIGFSIFASAGIAGIILGLAAQKVIATILAGIQIAITQPIRLDDVVIVEGEWGWIEEINLTFVVVRIWDKRRLVLPSNYFIEETFQNWTRTTAELMGTVFIHTDYTIPFEMLRRQLTILLEENPLWDKQVNIIQVTNAKESTVEIRALMSARNSSDLWDLRAHVREKLIEYIQKNFPESLPKTRINFESKENSPRDKN